MAVGAENSSNKGMEEEGIKEEAKDPGSNPNDSKIFKYCHQCRQKTHALGTACKNVRKGQPCVIKFCRKCLLNRYGEKVDEVENIPDWNCPKCRGVCNCSICRKRQGFQPTGMLVHTAKQSGFNSVHDLLDNNKDPESLKSINLVEGPSSAKKKSSQKGLMALKRCHDKDDQCEKEKDVEEAESQANSGKKKKKGSASKRLKINSTPEEGLVHSGAKTSSCLELDNPEEKEKDVEEAELQANSGKKIKKGSASRRLKINSTPEEGLVHSGAKTSSCLELDNPEELALEGSSNEDVILPQGSLLNIVGGVEVLPEDVGDAMQFLEFCKSFGKVLDINKGEPECILRDLMKEQRGCRGLPSSVVRLNIKLLSLLENNIDEKNWIQAVARCIDKYRRKCNILPEDISDKGLPGYEALGQSERLRIMNFLCSETLRTSKLRKWIDEEHGKLEEEKKEMREKVLAVKKEEKLLKQKEKDEIAQALNSGIEGDPSVHSEHDDSVPGIRTEADKEKSQLLESAKALPTKKGRREASGLEPLLLEGCRAYWKFRSCDNNSSILLQAVDSWDTSGNVDRWYYFNEEEEKDIEKHISSVKKPPNKRRKCTLKAKSVDDREKIDMDSANPSEKVEDLTLTSATLENISKVEAKMETEDTIGEDVTLPSAAPENINKVEAKMDTEDTKPSLLRAANI